MQPCPVAMPLAYWRSANDSFMTSALMLVTPSTTEFGRVMNATQRSDETIYDMEIMNNLYQDRALVIPHDPYILLTGEFRSSDHANYLGEGNNNWNPDDVLQKAKYLHFSDWPVPKVRSPCLVLLMFIFHFLGLINFNSLPMSLQIIFCRRSNLPAIQTR